MKKGRNTGFSCKRSGDARSRNPYSPFALLLHYTLFAPHPKFFVTFVLNFFWVLHSSQEKLKIMPTVLTRKTPRLLLNFSTVKCSSYLRAAFISLKAGSKTRTVLTMVLLRSNPAFWTPAYTDTSLSRAVCFVPAAETKPLHFLLI